MSAMLGDGIFCLEGEWSQDLRERMSVEPLLHLLEQLGIAPYIHRDVATVDEFEYYASKWQEKRYAKFKVLYLAMHGDAGVVYLGRDEVPLDELALTLRGACRGKVVYFGTCLTLKQDTKVLQQFARTTGARAVVGYRRTVDWLDCAAFEVLLLDRLARGVRSDAVFNRFVKEHGLFAKSLGLVVATRSQVHKVPLRQAKTST